MIKTGDDAVYTRIQLVIPKDVLAKVRETAQKERRNTSNMIVVMLEEAFSAREKRAETIPGPFVPMLREAA